MRALLARLVRPRTRWGLALRIAAGLASALGIWGAWRSGAAPRVPTVEARSGEFVDSVELRGEVKAVRSVTLNAPSIAEGDLQIIKIVKNGTAVRRGDLVVQFDVARLQRTLEQAQSDLKRAEAEIEEAQAQGRLQEEQNRTGLLQTKYDVERSRLDVTKQEIVSAIEGEKTKLRLNDAEQRFKEAGEKLRSGRVAGGAETESKRQKRTKALFDVQKAQRTLDAMTLRAPVDGMATILPNFRGRFFGSSPPEFKEGDRAWPGAAVVELPDLSSVRVTTRVDEAERGRLGPGQGAVVRVDAVPDREFSGRVAEISALAKIDFSTWPPPKNFDLAVQLDQTDPRLRPGMSATARVAVERLPGSVLVPASAVFDKGGGTVAYVARGSRFQERPIEVGRRTREQVAVAKGLAAGERVALKDPTEARP